MIVRGLTLPPRYPLATIRGTLGVALTTAQQRRGTARLLGVEVTLWPHRLALWHLSRATTAAQIVGPLGNSKPHWAAAA